MIFEECDDVLELLAVDEKPHSESEILSMSNITPERLKKVIGILLQLKLVKSSEEGFSIESDMRERILENREKKGIHDESV